MLHVPEGVIKFRVAINSSFPDLYGVLRIPEQNNLDVFFIKNCGFTCLSYLTARFAEKTTV